MNICWLNTTACQDANRVGGKAAQLSRLAQRHPVPPGFCLTAAGNGAATLTPRRRACLLEAYQRLGRQCGSTQPAVAVRSSAVDEDGQTVSFAGQHETYLNVSGLPAVAQAVQDCLDSALSERARLYRRAHGLDEGPGLAVLVQQFIPADVSAVVFSADPRSGRDDRILINACWGVGESLVGGSLIPDLYVVDKRRLTILQSEIGSKACMSVAHSGGTCQVATPRSLRSEPALSAAQVLALAHLALTLERSQGWAVDLECAFAGERLYLLQCRPITTLPATGVAH